MNRKVLIVGGLVVVPLLVFLAISFNFNPNLIDSPLIGKPAPDFTLQDLDGNIWSLAELKGKPVVINFWATWCQPCIAEHPVFLGAADFYGDQVQFLGVIYNDEVPQIRRFIAQRGAWGPALVDPDVAVAIAYGVYGAPETYFIGRDGTIVEKVTGPVDGSMMRRLVDGMLSS
jgi:cytochrome c biogenesis protein CcmG/thiol:disulfide interchange protein DsbE